MKFEDLLPIILAALVVSVIIFTLIGAFTGPKKRKVAPTQPVIDDSSHELILGDLTAAMSQQLPGQHRDQEQVLPQLKRAGYYSPTALMEYQAIRTSLILIPLIIAAAAAMLVEKALIPQVLFIGLIGAILGFSLPRIYIAVKANERAREVERGLPVFADLLSLALMSGQSLMASMIRVTGQIRGAFPGLAEELDIVLKQAEMLNLTVAFEQWANRSQVSDVRNLSVILTQSQKLGNEPATVLLEYANNLRITLRQRADAHAQRTGFWMLFPSIFCMWVPALVLLVAPVFFEFNKQRLKTREAFDEGREQLSGQQRGLQPNEKPVIE
jgi:tight adherence protein C